MTTERCARCAELQERLDRAEGIIRELSAFGRLARAMTALDVADAWRREYMEAIEAPNRCPNCGRLDGCLCRPLSTTDDTVVIDY